MDRYADALDAALARARGNVLIRTDAHLKNDNMTEARLRTLDRMIRPSLLQIACTMGTVKQPVVEKILRRWFARDHAPDVVPGLVRYGLYRWRLFRAGTVDLNQNVAAADTNDIGRLLGPLVRPTIQVANPSLADLASKLRPLVDESQWLARQHRFGYRFRDLRDLRFYHDRGDVGTIVGVDPLVVAMAAVPMRALVSRGLVASTARVVSAVAQGQAPDRPMVNPRVRTAIRGPADARLYWDLTHLPGLMMAGSNVSDDLLQRSMVHLALQHQMHAVRTANLYRSSEPLLRELREMNRWAGTRQAVPNCCQQYRCIARCLAFRPTTIKRMRRDETDGRLSRTSHVWTPLPIPGDTRFPGGATRTATGEPVYPMLPRLGTNSDETVRVHDSTLLTFLVDRIHPRQRRFPGRRINRSLVDVRETIEVGFSKTRYRLRSVVAVVPSDERDPEAVMIGTEAWCCDDEASVEPVMRGGRTKRVLQRGRTVPKEAALLTDKRESIPLARDAPSSRSDSKPAYPDSKGNDAYEEFWNNPGDERLYTEAFRRAVSDLCGYEPPMSDTRQTMVEQAFDRCSINFSSAERLKRATENMVFRNKLNSMFEKLFKSKQEYLKNLESFDPHRGNKTNCRSIQLLRKCLGDLTEETGKKCRTVTMYNEIRNEITRLQRHERILSALEQLFRQFNDTWEKALKQGKKAVVYETISEELNQYCGEIQSACQDSSSGDRSTKTEMKFPKTLALLESDDSPERSAKDKSKFKMRIKSHPASMRTASHGIDAERHADDPKKLLNVTNPRSKHRFQTQQDSPTTEEPDGIEGKPRGFDANMVDLNLKWESSEEAPPGQDVSERLVSVVDGERPVSALPAARSTSALPAERRGSLRSARPASALPADDSAPVVAAIAATAAVVGAIGDAVARAGPSAISKMKNQRKEHTQWYRYRQPALKTGKRSADRFFEPESFQRMLPTLRRYGSVFFYEKV